MDAVSIFSIGSFVERSNNSVTFFSTSRVMTMIPKELFLSTIEKILRQRERINEFEIALKELCDGHPVFDRENLYLEALLDLLKYSMKDTNDNIDWWLYEAPTSGYTVWWKENGEEVSADLSTPAALYDYLVEGANYEPTDDEKIDIVARKVMARYKPAFEELAKGPGGKNEDH